MSQLTLDMALAGVEANHLTWLEWARGEAKWISKLKGSVTSDDIRAKADLFGRQPDSPHAWGCLFKCNGWRFLGRTPSQYPSANGRYIGRWRYDPLS